MAESQKGIANRCANESDAATLVTTMKPKKFDEPGEPISDQYCMSTGTLTCLTASPSTRSHK